MPPTPLELPWAETLATGLKTSATSAAEKSRSENVPDKCRRNGHKKVSIKEVTAFGRVDHKVNGQELAPEDVQPLNLVVQRQNISV